MLQGTMCEGSRSAALPSEWTAERQRLGPLSARHPQRLCLAPLWRLSERPAESPLPRLFVCHVLLAAERGVNSGS